MTGKLLKDPEVSQEEEDNVAISEVSMHSLPCLPIFWDTHIPSGKGTLSGWASGQVVPLFWEWSLDH